MERWVWSGEMKRKHGVNKTAKIEYFTFYTCPICHSEITVRKDEVVPTLCYECKTELGLEGVLP